MSITFFCSPMVVQQGYGLLGTRQDLIPLYQAMGYEAHNGLDVCPADNSDWDIISPWDCEILKYGYKGANGNYVVLWIPEKRLSVWLLHMDFVSKAVINTVNMNCLKIRKVFYLGRMGHTGLSIGKNPDHLHIGVYQCDKHAYRLNRDNGYDGAISPDILLEE